MSPSAWTNFKFRINSRTKDSYYVYQVTIYSILSYFPFLKKPHNFQRCTEEYMNAHYTFTLHARTHFSYEINNNYDVVAPLSLSHSHFVIIILNRKNGASSNLWAILLKASTRTIFVRTSSASKPPGIIVPSFEQKQYGNVHASESHFFAKSSGASVIGAGAE